MLVALFFALSKSIFFPAFFAREMMIEMARLFGVPGDPRSAVILAFATFGVLRIVLFIAIGVCAFRISGTVFVVETLAKSERAFLISLESTFNFKFIPSNP